MAARTRICAVVSCNRVRVVSSRLNLATNETTTAVVATKTANEPSKYQPAAGARVRRGEQQ